MDCVAGASPFEQNLNQIRTSLRYRGQKVTYCVFYHTQTVRLGSFFRRNFKDKLQSTNRCISSALQHSFSFCVCPHMSVTTVGQCACSFFPVYLEAKSERWGCQRCVSGLQEFIVSCIYLHLHRFFTNLAFSFVSFVFFFPSTLCFSRWR